MSNDERHNKPGQTDGKKAPETQVQRDHKKPDQGKDDKEIANPKAQKPK